MRRPPMTPEEIARRRDEIAAHRGPWRVDNLCLARNVTTMGEGVRGHEARVRRAVQTIVDLVVLALGILDRLDAPAVFDVAKRLGSVCKGFELIEARLAARPRATRVSDGMIFRGAPRREHAATASRAERLAAAERSLDNERSFLPTRASMLSLLARSGFTSIAETLDPDAAEDAPCFAAFKGRRVALQTAPQANAVLPPGWGEAQPPIPRGAIARLLRRGRR